jgi:hypothetical protein
MADPENLMKREGTFLNSLQKTQQLQTEGIYLIASTKNQQTELVFYVPESNLKTIRRFRKGFPISRLESQAKQVSDQ